MPESPTKPSRSRFDLASWRPSPRALWLVLGAFVIGLIARPERGFHPARGFLAAVIGGIVVVYAVGVPVLAWRAGRGATVPVVHWTPRRAHPAPDLCITIAGNCTAGTLPRRVRPRRGMSRFLYTKQPPYLGGMAAAQRAKHPHVPGSSSGSG